MKKLSLLPIFLLCMGAFIFCILVSVAPLNRLAGTTLLSSLPFSILLTVVGTKLPTDLHLTTNVHASQVNTDAIEFLLVMVLVYLFYFLSAHVAQKYSTVQIISGFTDNSAQTRPVKTLLRYIWIGAVLVGIIYVLTPSALSHDATVYAGYGRVIIIYHANPYYTPLSAFPHDPFFQLDDWRDALAAYGPLWLIVCAISTLVAGSSILHYIFFYRILGLIAHLINIGLVTAILYKTKRSPRILVLGTLLYAWNPLVLLESGLGGHNDIVMVTCILLGIFLCVHAEQNSFIQARHYLPPMIAFTCAALIKFIAAAIILFYLILLARHIFTNKVMFQQQEHLYGRFRWLFMLRVVSCTTLVGGFLALTLYSPLWLGHTLQDIVRSLGSPPSSRLAFGSILLALQRVSAASQMGNSVLAFFSLHSIWNSINALVVVSLFCTGGLWLYRTPTTLTMVQATLGLLGALLIVTPWFFPWYVVWLVGLAAISIPTQYSQLQRALVGSTFVFSASALLIYLFRGYPPVGDWIGFTSLTTIGPPLIVLLYLLLPRKSTARTSRSISQSVEEAANQLAP
ncbi:MAG: hypothetical protein PVS3B3_07920 [Ktedonobacteraceae bacterium]